MATGFTSGDPRKVSKTGDTMTGELALSSSTPSVALIAASKAYADSGVQTAVDNATLAATALSVPQAQITTATALASDPFYIAHRGGGAVYPEHTMAAWDAAVSAGALSIEVSVHASADGVIFAMHDTTLDRMTEGTWTGTNTTWTWAELREKAKIKTGTLLGPGWSDQTIPTLDEILQRYLGKVCIFIEPKSNPAVTPLQTALSKYPGAYKSVVWKQHYTGLGFAWAKARGYVTWAYIDDNTSMAAMDAVEANVDMWGVPITATDAKFTEVLSRPNFKRVISWPIWRRSERDRLIGFNVGGKHVEGIMSSEYGYLTQAGPFRSVDAFNRGIKQPGWLPSIKEDPDYMIKFDTPNSSIHLDALSGSAAHLGDMSNNTAVGASGGYRISFQMKYVNLPGATIHGGLFFCATDDSKHQFNSTSNTVNSYRFLLRGNGDMQIYAVTAGVAAGTQLDTVNIGTIVADTWYSFQIDVLPTQLIVRSLTLAATRTVNDSTRRGKYFGIHNGSITVLNTIPHFKAMSVIPV